jgi:hypothetical protein
MKMVAVISKLHKPADECEVVLPRRGLNLWR